MLSKLGLILAVTFCFVVMNCFSNEQELILKHVAKFQKEIQKIEKTVNTLGDAESQAKIEAIKANIRLLESLVNMRIQKDQDKIDKYQRLIEDKYQSNDDSDFSSDYDSFYIKRLQKRISAKEKEIRYLQEILVALDKLKMKIERA